MADIFSLNPHNGESESNNVFVGLSTMLRSLRESFAKIGGETVKQVYEAGSEAVKILRYSIGLDPSKSDASTATNNLGGQSKAAQSAMSGMPNMNNLAGSGGSKSVSDTDDSTKVKAAAQQKFAQDMQRQRNAAQ